MQDMHQYRHSQYLLPYPPCLRHPPRGFSRDFILSLVFQGFVNEDPSINFFAVFPPIGPLAQPLAQLRVHLDPGLRMVEENQFRFVPNNGRIISVHLVIASEILMPGVARVVSAFPRKRSLWTFIFLLLVLVLIDERTCQVSQCLLYGNAGNAPRMPELVSNTDSNFGAGIFWMSALPVSGEGVSIASHGSKGRRR